MSGDNNIQGKMRLSSRLIITYFLVAAVAALTVIGVALPLLQRYQTERALEENQRLVLDNARQIEVIRTGIFRNDPGLNPFQPYLPFTRTNQPNRRFWPDAPPIEEVRFKISEQALDRGVRLLVLTDRDNEVQVDSNADPKTNLQGQSRLTLRQVQGSSIQNEGYLTTPSGAQFHVLYRRITSDNMPNLFGINQANQRPLSFTVFTVLPPVREPDVWSDLAPVLALGVLVALLLALVTGWLLARQLSRPVERLTAATQAVARGDYEQRVVPLGGQELQRLAESFNLMTEAVADSQRQQRQLIANVSHELKTPLTSIQGFSQAMLDGALRRPEQYAHAAQIISGESDRMIRLVQSLLDLSRLESGEAALQKEKINLASVLQQSAASFQGRADAAEVALTTDFNDLLWLDGDHDRLRQVFNNLLDNALKYTPTGGYISLNAETHTSEIVVRVKDSGAGIPAVDLPHIFERFYQADKSRRRDLAQEGTGLGLAIVREIVQSHGGKVEAISAESLGSEFIVTLPTTYANTAPKTLQELPENAAKVAVVNKN